MAFDPTLPANGSLIAAAELRSQFTGLDDKIGELPTQAQLSNDLVNTQNATTLAVLPQTSNNTNTISLLSLTVGDPPTQSDVQTIVNKVDELITALRR